MGEHTTDDKRKSVRDRVEQFYARYQTFFVHQKDKKPLRDFLDTTRDFDIAASLRAFETPKMIAQRNARFKKYVRN